MMYIVLWMVLREPLQDRNEIRVKLRCSYLWPLTALDGKCHVASGDGHWILVIGTRIVDQGGCLTFVG